MAAPVFVKAGTGVVIASGSAACTLAGTTAGNIIILQVLRDGTASAVTLSAITNIENLAGTDNALTDLALLQPVGSPTAAAQSLYIGRSLGGTVSVTVATAGDDLYYRLYEFSGANTGTTLAAVTESIANGVGTGTTVSDTGVTTTAADRLPLQFVAVNDDLAVGPFTGATGGTWVEPVPEFASATGTDGCIQLQLGYVVPISWVAPTGTAYGIGSTSVSQIVAQPFTATAAGTIDAVLLKLGANGTPTDDIIIRVETDASGSPSGTVVGTAVTLAAPTATRDVVASVQAPVASGTKYHITARRTGALNASNHARWILYTSVAYAGHPVRTYDGSIWTAQSETAGFAVLTGLDSSATINGGTFAMASGGWGVVGLALIPPVGGPATLERQAALAAVGLIATIGRELLARVVALNAVGAVASSGIKVTPAVTVERAAAVAATGQVAAAGISVVKASAAVTASAGIASAGQERLSRSVAFTAVAGIASAGREQLARLAELAAATNISVAGQVESGTTIVERSAAVSAAAAIATVGRELLSRSAAVSAATLVTTTGQKAAHRPAALTAQGAVTTAGEIEGATVRAAAVAATGSVSATGTVTHVRAGAAALTATGTLTSVPQRALGRAAGVAVTPTLAAQPQRALTRTAGLDTLAAITTVTGNVGQASFTAIATITLSRFLEPGYLTSTRAGRIAIIYHGQIPVSGLGGIEFPGPAEGELALATVGGIARTGG